MFVSDSVSKDITQWLKKLNHGSSESFNQVMELVYQEMRHLARRQMRSERKDHTLCTTGLVNEAYLKLSKQQSMKFNSRAEFYAFASQCMRHILVDHARAHSSVKRGSGEKPTSLQTNSEPLQDFDQLQAQEICDIDAALDRLEQVFPRGAQVIQYRLFGGLNLQETAEIIDVSSKTVQRDWITAIAWLRKEVGGHLYTLT